MNTAIIITAIICATLIAITAIGAWNKQQPKPDSKPEDRA